MAVLLLLVLLSAAELSRCGAEDQGVPELYREGTELALDQVHSHSGVQIHFRFFKTISTSEIDGGFGGKFLFHNFLLKPTKCPKGTRDMDLTKCAFRTDRPMIDCAMCYKTFNGVIEKIPKPYVHCVHKPALTKGMIAQRTQTCQNVSYSSGAASVLLVKSPE
ncbi:retinoic acid receptor responder protein 2-like [Hoplias malabaricus]|uniref:retinoic acid receptor responder protein 2-like n=1 Tax=Hoplias malabaricus TaxID=27720 RepID=UPI003461FB9D